MFEKCFASLKGNFVIVELKNDIVIKGKLYHIDSYYNIKLIETTILNSTAFPHIKRINDCFIRGSNIKYIHLPPDEVNLEALREKCKAHMNDYTEKMKSDSFTKKKR